MKPPRKIYVAGRYQSYKKCRQVIDQLKEMGFEITQDWTRSEAFNKNGDTKDEFPFDRSREENIRYASLDVLGVKLADTLVLLADDSLAGAYVEMGIAIAEEKQILVVAHNRWTIFFELPQVSTFGTYDDFFRYMERVKPEPVMPESKYRCPLCKQVEATRREIGNGDYEDYRYDCHHCGHHWITEGIDS